MTCTESAQHGMAGRVRPGEWRNRLGTPAKVAGLAT